MKKILSVLLAVCALFMCLVAFSACGSASQLRLDERYIHETSVGEAENKQEYYIFHKDGTGEYYYHYDYESSWSEYDEHKHYAVKFKYTFVDNDKETIYCAYDGYVRLAGHVGSGVPVSTTWSRLITVSKNLIMSTSGSSINFYINENYAKELPNFNK